MPLTAIVTIVLRLFSLNWILQGFFWMSSAGADFVHSRTLSTEYWRLAPLVGLVVAGILLFLWSTLVARIVTPRPNPEIVLGELTQYDLYCFAFTFLGLYFVLSSVADTLNWLHYSFMVARDTNDGDPKRADALYQITRPLITLLAGGASVFLAPRFARKLTECQRKA